MAEVNNTRGNKKHNLRVDLTPMVDLGFLLITFFILTTTMQEMKTLDLIVPNDTKDNGDFLGESTVLNIVLQKDNNITWYEGSSTEVKHNTIGGLRNLIQQKQKQLNKSGINADLFTLIIKPAPQSNYNTLIRALDEVSINNCYHYYVTPPDKDEIL